MHRLIRFVVAASFVAAAAAPAFAAATYSGSLMCAMCMLKKADAHECQDVLVVTDAKGAKTEFYITKNDVAAKAGEACTAEVKATVTGTVSEKDGKTWLTPSKIEKH
ncbi:MAG: DUF6370 family protein [Acidobacteriota bacterium]